MSISYTELYNAYLNLQEELLVTSKDRDHWKIICNNPDRIKFDDMKQLFNPELLNHNAEVIDDAIKSISGYVTVSQVPHSQYAAGWNDAVKRIEDYASQLRDESREAD